MASVVEDEDPAALSCWCLVSFFALIFCSDFIFGVFLIRRETRPRRFSRSRLSRSPPRPRSTSASSSRNILPGYQQVVQGEWNVAGIAYRAYDLEGKTVGTVGAGRIGRLLLQHLKPFNCNLLYHDRLQIELELEKEIGPNLKKTCMLCFQCVMSLRSTHLLQRKQDMFNKERIAKMKKGVIIVNNARGAIMDTQAVVEACSSGHIAGYGSDVWFPKPTPKDHPWRYMTNHAMTPHISGTTIDAQDMLDRYFKGEDFPVQNYIVKKGRLASQYQ